MPTPEYHARLSPSSAKRWLNCPASVKLSADIPSTTSQYAEAGRLAHSIAELKAQKRFAVMSKRTYNSQLKKLQEDPKYLPEMDGYTDIYVETLEQHAMAFSSPPFVAFESAVPVGTYTGENKPDGSPATGTADCIQIGDDTLWITDYKNGAGVPVDADHNPQMMIYALGALMLYGPIYGDTIQTVKMTIVQPALRSVSDFEIPRAELEEWGLEVLSPGAAKAASDDPGEPCPGDWCRFCPCKNTCRARSYKYLALEAFEKAEPAGKPGAVEPLLSDAEIGNILARGADLLAWYKDLEAYALQACLAGKDITGYKAVAGRSAREWDDLDSAFADLQQRGVAEAVLWERKPVTAPALEKAIGKKDFAVVAADHVVMRPGKPTLVPASDKRPAYEPAAAAFEVLA